MCICDSVGMSYTDKNELFPHSNIEYERKMYHQSALCGHINEGDAFSNRFYALTMVFEIEV